MAETKRVILFSTGTERTQATSQALHDAGFEVVVVSELSLLMREVRNARDRVVVLDFQSQGIDGPGVLQQIKHLDGSIQVLVINAEPKVFEGIQIFRAGGEACFFAPSPPITELCEALNAAYDKIARWWRALQEIAASRTSGEAQAAVVSGKVADQPARPDDQYPRPNDVIEVTTRGLRMKGKVTTSSSAGMEFAMTGTEMPALFDNLLVRYRDVATRGVVRRIAPHPSGGWLVGLEWHATFAGSSVSVGAQAERALFVLLDGHHVVARSLVAVNKDWVSARLATGRMHAVPTNAVCALTRSEREAELLTAEDLAFFATFYQLGPLAGLAATAQAIMAIEFAVEESAA
jgi:DNA-binding response OmpR family regulator